MIYIVSVGEEYGECEICGVFTDKIKAEKLRDKILNYDTVLWKNVRVEEWEDGEISNWWRERLCKP